MHSEIILNILGNERVQCRQAGGMLSVVVPYRPTDVKFGLGLLRSFFLLD